MRVAVKKLPGVQSVDVSLGRAVTEIRLNPGNTVTLAQLRKILKDGGFNSGAADVDVMGTLTQRDGAPTLLVSGTTEAFRLIADPKNPGSVSMGDRERRNERRGRLGLRPGRPCRNVDGIQGERGTPLIGFQRDQRIYPCCVPGRNVRGERDHGHKNDGHS